MQLNRSPAEYIRPFREIDCKASPSTRSFTTVHALASKNWTNNRKSEYGVGMRWFVLAIVCGFWLGCEPDRPDVLKEYPPPRRIDAPVEQTKPLRLTTTGGDVVFEVKLGGVALAGKIPVTSAELRLKPSQLAHTQGDIELDLSQMTLGEMPEGNQHWVQQSLDLLLAQAPRARFRFWELHALSASSIWSSRSRKMGDTFVTKVRGSARGHLELNGLRTIQNVRVELSFEHPQREFYALPERLTLSSHGRHTLLLERHGLGIAGVRQRTQGASNFAVSPPTPGVPERQQTDGEPMEVIAPPALGRAAKLSFQLEFNRDTVAQQ